MKFYLITVMILFTTSCTDVSVLPFSNCRLIQSSPKMELNLIYKSQLDYKAKHGTYSDDLAKLNLQWEDGPKYNIFFNHDVIACTFGVSISSLPLEYKLRYNDNEWNAFAIRNIDGDDDLDVWMITNDGKLTHLKDDCIN